MASGKPSAQIRGTRDICGSRFEFTLSFEPLNLEVYMGQSEKRRAGSSHNHQAVASVSDQTQDV